MHSASELARRSKSPRGLALEVPSEAIQYRTLNRSYWAGSTTAEYIFFGGQRIAMIPAGSNPLYYVEDLLGTSRIVADNAGVVCYDADFYPFGGERAYTNTCPQNNYKFEGKERDTETGNDDFGARYYSNRFGRWLSADWSNVPTPVPYANLTNPQTLNLYAMVSDDPESFADLDGHLLNFGRSPNPYDPSEPCLHANWFCLPPAAYTDSAAQQEAQQQQNQSAQAQNNTPTQTPQPPQPTQPQDHTLTVSAYEGAHGYGHVGIGIDSTTTQGLYPAHEETAKDKAKILAGQDVPGTVHTDTARRTDTITLHVTKDQANLVRAYLSAAQPPHSGTYNLYGRNRARFVEGALGTANLRSSDTKYPHDLMTALHRRYDEQ